MKSQKILHNRSQIIACEWKLFTWTLSTGEMNQHDTLGRSIPCMKIKLTKIVIRTHLAVKSVLANASLDSKLAADGYILKNGITKE